MKITDFWDFFLKMGTSPKSSIFSTVGSSTSTQRWGSAIGTTIGKHNREKKRETTEKNEKWKKQKKHIYIFYFILLL